MKKTLFHFPFLLVIALGFLACSKEDSKVEDANYSNLLSQTAALEEEHKIDSAFYLFNSYSINEDVPVYYRNKAKLELSRLYQKQGAYIESEAIIVSILESNSDSTLVPHIHNDLGIVFKEQQQFEKSIENYEIAKEKSSLELHKAIINNNIGVVHLEEEKYVDAITTLAPLLSNAALKEYPFFYVKAVDNLGYAYLNTNELQKADSLLHRGYFIRDSINDDYGKIASTIHLAKLYAKQNDTVKGISLANEAYKIATSIKSPDDRMEALDLLVRFDKNNDWYSKLAFIQDSITTVRQNNKNQFAKIRYDEAKALELVKKEKTQKIILAIVIVFIGIVVVLFFRLLQQRNKRKQIQAIYNTETKISKKVHDELANDIFQTLSYVEIIDKKEPNFKDELLDKLEHIYEKSRSISRENNVIRTEEEYENELVSLINGFNNAPATIVTKGLKDVDWKKFSKEKKITIYRSIQELLVNMKKHSQAKLVLLSFEVKEKQLHITYKDNGKGVSQLNLKNGLQNVENRIEDVSGKCTFESENGFKVQLNIPF